MPYNPALSKLKDDAERAFYWRNHEPQEWVDESYTVATLTCRTCGRWVQVNTLPGPNEIDIGGPAVALNCEDKDNAY